MKNLIKECKVFIINFFGSSAFLAFLFFTFGDALAMLDFFGLVLILLLSVLAAGSLFFIIMHIVVYFRKKRINSENADNSRP